VQLTPGFKPHLLRVDWLTVRLWEQGRDQPRELVLADGATSAAPLTRGYVELVHNTFAAPSPDAAFVLELEPLREAVAFAVEVELGFAALEMPAPLQERLQHQVAADDVERARRTVTGMQSSLSWRVTKPLRAAKRLTGR
jgi:hypothetical protein